MCRGCVARSTECTRSACRGLARRGPASACRCPGVDETSFQRRHEYVTVVADIVSADSTSTPIRSHSTRNPEGPHIWLLPRPLLDPMGSTRASCVMPQYRAKMVFVDPSSSSDADREEHAKVIAGYVPRMASELERLAFEAERRGDQRMLSRLASLVEETIRIDVLGGARVASRPSWSSPPDDPSPWGTGVRGLRLLAAGSCRLGRSRGRQAGIRGG